MKRADIFHFAGLYATIKLKEKRKRKELQYGLACVGHYGYKG